MVTITIRGENPEINMPDVCPVCLMPSTVNVSVHNVLFLITEMPSVTTEHKYCDRHYKAYKKSLIVEKLLRWIMLVGCVALGTSALVFFTRFVAGYTHPGILIFMGAVGTGIGLVVSGMGWAFLRMINYYLVPRRYKAVHDALRVKSFNFEMSIFSSVRTTRITFTSSNEEYARLLAEANQVKVEY